METKFLPQVRAETRGLKGDLHYGAIDIGGPEVLIGVVSGESPAAYAVRMVRGKTHWRISEETYARGLVPQIVLERPDPAAVLASGRTAISFTAWAYTPGSVYPNAELWIDSRHVDGHLDPGQTGLRVGTKPLDRSCAPPPWPACDGGRGSRGDRRDRRERVDSDRPIAPSRQAGTAI